MSWSTHSASQRLVLVAVQHAPVGYVAALRESSVLIAVFVGSRYLGEGKGRTRMIAAGMILSGLVLLVISIYNSYRVGILTQRGKKPRLVPVEELQMEHK